MDSIRSLTRFAAGGKQRSILSPGTDANVSLTGTCRNHPHNGTTDIHLLSDEFPEDARCEKIQISYDSIGASPLERSERTICYIAGKTAIFHVAGQDVESRLSRLRSVFNNFYHETTDPIARC